MAIIELTGYKFKKDKTSGQSGTRVFVVEEDTVSATSPVQIGDQHNDGEASARCICRTIQKAVYGRDSRKAIFICEYSTKPFDNGKTTPGNTPGSPNPGGGPGFDPEFLPKGFELSGELVEVSAKAQWKWGSDNAVIDFGDENRPVLVKRVVTGALTIEKLLRSFSVTTFITVIGRTGDIPFAGGSPDNWLCAGITAQQEIDEDGNDRWRARATFLLRVVQGNKGWSYIWRTDTGTWDFPVSINGGIGTTTGFLYERATNMMEIFKDW